MTKRIACLGRLSAGPPTLVACLILMALVAGACIKQQEIYPAGAVSQPSPKLTPFAHFEDGAILFIGVDGRAAQYVNEGTIFPLGIGLANQSRKPMTFHRESFTLETSDGKRYPLVSIQEFNRDYNRSRSDERLADSFREALLARFYNYTYIKIHMFPYKGETATATNSFELGRLFWTQFYLYFPIPEDGIHGKEFNLLVQVSEAEETFVVRFALK